MKDTQRKNRRIIRQNRGITSETHTDNEKIKAACALNMCTVSVSQIVDYHDAYILEQEYDAILNNLNLKEMPKDEALLHILKELLNTITFFRIQDIRKQQIEKRYQQKISNAIWSAIPSLSVIAVGNPVSIAVSLVTQIGTGYMNYRREKANAGIAREDEEIELQITAIEQLNALRRELFTTAWYLADEYDFPDEWRLTEKQIKQYNSILMDPNEYRKYTRLESVADRFAAYPPFWYFYGHTANYIAEQAKNQCRKSPGNGRSYEAIREHYTALAKQHYEYYYQLTINNILREDQLTAACALEYVDLLWEEEKRDTEKIYSLLNLAEKMAPNSFDILQLCAISYLKIGKTEDAERLLKILVNEGYSAVSNAVLLSRIYVDQMKQGKNASARAGYQLLREQINPGYLCPLSMDGDDWVMDEEFLSRQKEFLKKEYYKALYRFSKKQLIAFNRVLPWPGKKQPSSDRYYNNSLISKATREEIVKKFLDSNYIDRILKNAEGVVPERLKTIFKNDRNDYLTRLNQCHFVENYIRILNETVAGIETLPCFRQMAEHDDLIYQIEKQLYQSNTRFREFQEKMNSNGFNYEDYETLVNTYSYQYFVQDFFEALEKNLFKAIDQAQDLGELERLRVELMDFCDKYQLSDMDEAVLGDAPHDEESGNTIFLGRNLDEQNVDLNKIKEEARAVLKEEVKAFCKEEPYSLQWGHTRLLFEDTQQEAYFQRHNLKMEKEAFSSIYEIRQSVLAILERNQERSADLILCTKGIAFVENSKIYDLIGYDDVKSTELDGQPCLRLGYPAKIYLNEDVKINELADSLSKKVGSKLKELEDKTGKS